MFRAVLAATILSAAGAAAAFSHAERRPGHAVFAPSGSAQARSPAALLPFDRAEAASEAGMTPAARVFPSANALGFVR